jgi:shikimate kinase
MKIVLLGYMASGKSAIGKLLALDLGMQFVDLDDFIEAKEGMKISEIFSKKGEIYFRIKEGEYLKEILNFNENYIISLGGGTPCYGNNMENIIENSTSFYLKASINTIFDRLDGETTKRPLVANLTKESLKEFIAKHLFERSPYYEKASHTINVNDKTVAQLINEIKTYLL